MTKPKPKSKQSAPVKISSVREKDRRFLQISGWAKDGPTGRPHWIELRMSHDRAREIIDDLFKYLRKPVGADVVTVIGWCHIYDVKNPQARNE